VKTLRELVVGLFVVVTFPIWIVAIIILKLFEKPADLEPAEVEAWLQKMAAGEIDQYWWDDFLSIPIKDACLDAIREECEILWDPRGGFLKRTGGNSYELNHSGRQRVQALIEECHRIENRVAQKHA